MSRHTRRSARRRSRRSTSRAKRVRRSRPRSSKRVRYRSASSQIHQVIPNENVFRAATPSLFTRTTKKHVPNTHNIYFMTPITFRNEQTWLAVNERRMALLRGKQSETTKQPHITLFQVHFHPELSLDKVRETSTNLKKLVPYILQNTSLTHVSDDFSLLSSESVLGSAFYAKEYDVSGVDLTSKLTEILGAPLGSDNKYVYFGPRGQLDLAIPHFSLAILAGHGKFHISLVNFADVRTHNSDTFDFIFEGVDANNTHVKDLEEGQRIEILERVKLMEVPGTNDIAALNYKSFKDSDPRQSTDPSQPREMYMSFHNIQLSDFSFDPDDDVKNGLGTKPGETKPGETKPPSSSNTAIAMARLERSIARWSKK